MRSKAQPLPTYRFLLRLYPMTYRQEYGDQMVRTLQDMLDDCETSEARMLVWLRVSIEVPFSALQESISNIRRRGMKKPTLTPNKRLSIDIGVLLIAILIVVIGLGHNRLVMEADNIFYGGPLRTALNTQEAKIDNPFQTIVGTTPKPVTSCSVDPQSGLKTELDCSSSMQAYTKLGQTASDKAKALSSVTAITAALKAQGYKGGSNGVTLTSLVSGTYRGVDWSPDAFYQKVVGKDTCIFDTLIAYSNNAKVHQQPAIHMSLWCSRTLDPIGKPSNQIPSSVTYGTDLSAVGTQASLLSY